MESSRRRRRRLRRVGPPVRGRCRRGALGCTEVSPAGTGRYRRAVERARARPGPARRGVAGGDGVVRRGGGVVRCCGGGTGTHGPAGASVDE